MQYKPVLVLAWGSLVLAGNLLIPVNLSWSEEEGQDWYDYYSELDDDANQADTLLPPPTRETHQGSPYEGPPGYNPDRTPGPGKKVARKHWWQFWKKETIIKPPPEEKIVDVGPREFPAAKEPLLRWPMPWRSANGLIKPGLYLIQVNPLGAGPAVTLPENDKALIAGKPSAYELRVMQGKQILFKTPVARVAARQAPPGPVEALPEDTNPHKEPINQGPAKAAAVELSPDKQQIKLWYQIGSARYESPWFRQQPNAYGY